MSVFEYTNYDYEKSLNIRKKARNSNDLSQFQH